MKVYSDRNNIQVELYRQSDYVKNIDFSAVGKFQVGQQFMKLGSLLYMRCCHRSVKSVRRTAVEQDISFPANKRGTQLWNSESL